MAAKKTPAAKKTAAPIEKHPKLRALFNQLHKDKEVILKKSAPARKKREELLEKIQPLEAKLREVNAEIAQIERPALGEIDMQISGLAKAMGGRSMSDTPDTKTVQEETVKE